MIRKQLNWHVLFVMKEEESLSLLSMRKVIRPLNHSGMHLVHKLL